MKEGGTQLVTADAVVGTSGQPIKVYAIHIISDAGGAGSVVLKNGTTSGGTARISETGTADKGTTITFGISGMYFPDGCFADIGTNTTSVAVSYVQL